MAQPIRPTPILKGEDAIRFMKKMQAVEKRKPNNKEKRIMKEIGLI